MQYATLNNRHFVLRLMLVCMTMFSMSAWPGITLTLNNALVEDQAGSAVEFTSATIDVAAGILTLQSAQELFCAPTPVFDPTQSNSLALVVGNNPPLEIDTSTPMQLNTVFRAVGNTELVVFTTGNDAQCFEDTIFLDGFED